MRKYLLGDRISLEIALEEKESLENQEKWITSWFARPVKNWRFILLNQVCSSSILQHIMEMDKERIGSNVHIPTMIVYDNQNFDKSLEPRIPAHQGWFLSRLDYYRGQLGYSNIGSIFSSALRDLNNWYWKDILEKFPTSFSIICSGIIYISTNL